MPNAQTKFLNGVDAASNGAATASAKARRNRRKMSCVPCVERKIKCDRNVPGCSSCILRNIKSLCRWGDERDNVQNHSIGSGSGSSSSSGSSGSSDEDNDRLSKRDGKKLSSNTRRTQKRKSTRTLDEIDESAWDFIVEKVVKRLKGESQASNSSRRRKVHSEIDDKDDGDDQFEEDDDVVDQRISKKKSRSSSLYSTRSPLSHHRSAAQPPLKRSTSSTASDPLRSLLHYDLRPPPNPDIKYIPTSAFEGKVNEHLYFFAQASNSDGDDEQIAHDKIASTLRYMPKQRQVQQLIDVYLDEIEPTKCVLNHVIFALQLNEFWHDVAHLGIETGTTTFRANASTSLRDLPTLDPAMSLSHSSTSPSNSSPRKDKHNHALCSVPRQGLIALIFCLIELGGRSAGLPMLIELGILPDDATEEDVMKWGNLMTDCARIHMDLSEYVARPTLWSVQAVLLNDMVNPGYRNRNANTADSMSIWKFSAKSSSNMLAVYLSVQLGLNRLGSAYDDVKGMTSPQTAERRNNARNTISATMPSQNALGKSAAASAKTPSSEQQSVLATISLGTWVSEFEEGNLAYRELGRKLWTAAVMMDGMMSTHLNQFHCVHDGIDHTAPPMPLNDEDLVSPNVAALITQNLASAVETPKLNTYCAFMVALAKVARTQIQWENSKGAPLPYKDLTEIDQRFRAVLAALPWYLSVKHNGADEAASTFVDVAIALQRSIINDQCYFRILRLHRQHLGRGLRDKRYRRSTEACLEAASGILNTRTLMERARHKIRSSQFLHSHLVHAALVFRLVLMHEMDRSRSLTQRSANGFDDGDDDNGNVYTADDFDGILGKLHLSLEYLRPGANNTKGKEFIPSLEQFLKGVENYRAAQRRSGGGGGSSSNQMVTQATSLFSSSQKQRRNQRQSDLSESTDAATILAAMPSPLPGVPSLVFHGASNDAWPATAPPPRPQQPLHAQSNATPSSSLMSGQSSVEYGSGTPSTSFGGGFDPTLWSLESLFPNYFLEGIDLISALEQQVLSGNSSNGDGSSSIGASVDNYGFGRQTAT